MRALVLLLASIATTLTPQPAAAQRERQMGGVGISVFADEGFRGRNATFRDEVRDLQEFDLNDRISSLRVARGETWEVCEHDNFKGRCQIFSGDEPDLRERRWNDIISSMRRVRGGSGGGRPGGRFAIELFADRAFSGERRAFTGEVSNLQLEGFNDRARSLRLPGSQSWEVCVDADYRNCRVLNSDWSDLRQVGMDRRISSLRPWRQGGGGGFPPPGSSMRLVLFGGVDYRGASLALDQANRNLGGTRPQSLQVFGGVGSVRSPEFQRPLRGRAVQRARRALAGAQIAGQVGAAAGGDAVLTVPGREPWRAESGYTTAWSAS